MLGGDQPGRLENVPDSGGHWRALNPPCCRPRSSRRTSTSTADPDRGAAERALEALLALRERRAGRGAGPGLRVANFAGDSKAKMLEMVHDIENAMDRDIDQLDWMSAETKSPRRKNCTLSPTRSAIRTSGATTRS